MPTYDYRCAACGHQLEIFHGIAEKPRKTCPRCKKPRLERLISAGAGLVFKGSGFYLTDYRSESYKAGEKREQGATGSGAGAEKPEAAAKSEAAKPEASSTPEKRAAKREPGSDSQSGAKPPRAPRES